MFNLKLSQRRKLFLGHGLPVVLIASVFLTLSSHAHEPIAGQGRMSFGPLTSRFIYSPTPVPSPTFIGLGFLGEIDISKTSGIEVGMFYFESEYSVESSERWLAERAQRIYIPIGYRFWFSSKVSLAASFYAAYRIGKWTEVYRSPGISISAVTSAQDITEYGFDFSVQTDLYTTDNYILILDSRFTLPTTDKPDENSRSYMFLLGWKFRVH